MKKKRIILIGILILVCNILYSQKNVTPAVPSSNAISLGVYGEVPVSHFTGIPGISLDLYQMKGVEISVPISLSYHAAGVRPEIHPGWVGQNWSLQAGGVITRTIKKLPDEHKTENTSVGYYHQVGFNLWNNLINDGIDWKTYPMNGGFTAKTSIINFQCGKMPFFDLEPDEFSFNFLGMSGKFYLTDNGQWVSSEGNKFKIIFENNFIKPFAQGSFYGRNTSHLFSDSFYKFTIVDEAGNRYIFGGNENAIEYSEDINLNPNAYGSKFWATSWYLTEVISVNKADKIDFKYERGPFTAQLFKHGSYFIKEGSSFGYSNWKTSGNFISPVYLKEIDDNKGTKITFEMSKSEELSYSKANYRSIFTNASTTDFELLDSYDKIPYFRGLPSPDRLDRIIWLKLDKIMVNHTSSFSRTFTFDYNNISSERLFLKSVYDGLKRTAFNYKNIQQLPAYLTTVTDHWGFNNNRGYGNFDSSIFSSRELDQNAVQYGILDTIYYPTGGKTAFEYENHDYSKVVKSNDREVIENRVGTAGGLRIKKLTNYPIQGPVIIKEYYYKKDYLTAGSQAPSSGVLENYPKYYYEQLNDKTFGGSSFSYKILESNPILPLTSNSSGCHVGYSEVTEMSKGSTSENYYTVYKYTNHDNGYCDKNAEYLYNRSNAVYNQPNSRGFERGKLQEKINCNQDKGKVSKNRYIWERRDVETNRWKSISYDLLDVGLTSSEENYFPSSVAYYNYTYPFLLTKEESILYSNNASDSIVSTTEYGYNQIYQTSSISVRNSDNSSHATLCKYPNDLKSDLVYQKMVDNNILSPLVEKTTSKNNITVRREITDYELQHSSFYAPIRQRIQIGNFNPEVREVYQYNAKGNLNEIIKDNSDKVVYLWGYNYQYPIAEIKGASYADVTAKINDATLKSIAEKNTLSPSDSTLIGNLRDSLSNALVTTYTYKPLVGVASVTDPRKVTIRYEYDNFGRLTCIRDDEKKVIEKYEYNYKQ